MKSKKGGQITNTLFISSEINNIMMTSASLDSQLAKKLSKILSEQPSIARGRTKPVEKGGLPVSIGLKKKDPFNKDGCDFGDNRCPIDEKQSYSTMGSCYRAICECTNVNDSQINLNDDENYNYIGTTGTSVHNRHLAHMKSITNK